MFSICFKADACMQGQDVCLCYNTKNEILLCNPDGRNWRLPRCPDLDAGNFPANSILGPTLNPGVVMQPVFLGSWVAAAGDPGTNVWLIRVPDGMVDQDLDGENWQWEGLRAFSQTASADVRDMTFRGLHLRNWLARFKFCPACGVGLELSSREIALHCPVCDADWYPSISPAMIVAITRNQGSEILLARPKNRPHNWFSLIAGYCEAGESVEATVFREVSEEVGIKIKQLCYVASQGWPFSHSLMLGYTAEWESGEVVPDHGELEEAAWFPLANLPSIPPPPTIAHTLITLVRDRFLSGAIK